MDQYCIETRNLWKTYGEKSRKVNAISDVSIRIPFGKTTCIIGPSGSGKSTLLGLIGLLIRPSRGEVILEGESVKGISEIKLTEIRKNTFGFIFQAQYLLEHFTTLENVRLPLYSHDIALKESNQRASEILKQLSLSARTNFYVKELSGGEAQRTCIARALIVNPSILIADEPSSNIDSKLTEEFLQIVEEYKLKRNLTVIMASHDPQVTDSAEYIIELSDGRIKNK